MVFPAAKHCIKVWQPFWPQRNLFCLFEWHIERRSNVTNNAAIEAMMLRSHQLLSEQYEQYYFSFTRKSQLWNFLSKIDFLSFLPKFPPASSCFFTRPGTNFFAQKMNFTIFYLVRKLIYPKNQWNFQKTGKFIFWKMNFTVFLGKFIFWLNKNG